MFQALRVSNIVERLNRGIVSYIVMILVVIRSCLRFDVNYDPMTFTGAS